MNDRSRWMRRSVVLFGSLVGSLVLTSGLWAQAVADKAPAQSGSQQSGNEPFGNAAPRQ